MRRDHAVTRAVLLTAGIGTVLGAGAGIASAAEGIQMAPTGPSLDQASALQGLGAPNLSLADGATQAAGTSHDAGNVSGADLAVLGGLTNGQLSTLGSGSTGAQTLTDSAGRLG